MHLLEVARRRHQHAADAGARLRHEGGDGLRAFRFDEVVQFVGEAATCCWRSGWGLLQRIAGADTMAKLGKWLAEEARKRRGADRTKASHRPCHPYCPAHAVVNRNHPFKGALR